MSTENTTPRLQSLLVQNRKARRRENIQNTAKFFGILLLLCVVFELLGLYGLDDSGLFGEYWFFPFLAFLTACLWFAFVLVLQFFLFFALYGFPFLLYLWVSVWAVRQRTIRSLIQASAETKTPLAGMIRAYACDCFSPFFRKRLNRFALMLEHGYTLEQAADLDRGLVQYDLVAMLRLGGNDPATLRSIDNSECEDRESSTIRSLTFFRLTYLLALIFPFLFVVLFVMTRIIPQFESIFQDFGADLPPLTAVFFQFLSLDGGFGTVISFVFSILFWGALLFIFLKIIQTNVIVWRPCFFRWLFREIDSAKFLRLLSTGLNHQVSLPVFLQTYRQIIPSKYLQYKAMWIERRIVEGNDWLTVLREERIVTSPEYSLLETAERTGNLTAMLEQIAVSKERAQLRRDDLRSKLLFIPCLLGMAACVGIFVIAMFLPLVYLIKALV